MSYHQCFMKMHSWLCLSHVMGSTFCIYIIIIVFRKCIFYIVVSGISITYVPQNTKKKNVNSNLNIDVDEIFIIRRSFSKPQPHTFVI